MFQPRLGFAYDIKGDGKQVVRANAGLYYARIPGLNLASSRSTDGSRGPDAVPQQRGSPRSWGRRRRTASCCRRPPAGPFQPGVFVFDKDFENPRTFTATVGYEREIGAGVAAGAELHPRADRSPDPLLQRATTRCSATPVGAPAWRRRAPTASATLTVVQSTRQVPLQRHHRRAAARRSDPRLQFQVNYTLSFDKSDDDNERDPFTFRYARADSLETEYNWSDRDQRHRFNAWVLAVLPGDFYLNNRLERLLRPAGLGELRRRQRGHRDSGPSRRRSASAPTATSSSATRSGEDNAYFSWDIRLSGRSTSAGRGRFEAIFEVFNVTNTDNFKDPSSGGVS